MAAIDKSAVEEPAGDKIDIDGFLGRNLKRRR
jgi:hypothetical protein